MQSYTRALAAASAYTVLQGRKVSGLYDFTAGEHLQIAAECRGQQLRGSDGDRAVSFGGQLPDLYDEGTKAYLTLDIEGDHARGYDHASASHYEARVSDRVIQLYDHGAKAWFSFEPQLG